MILAQKLSLLRQSRDLLQTDMAKIAGVSKPSISQWESGQRSPKLKAIRKICEHFGIDLAKFLDESNDYYNSDLPNNLNPLQIARKQPDNTDTLSALKRESERLERQINRLIDLYAVGNISVETIAKRSEVLTSQKEEIDRQIAEQRSTPGIQPEQAVQLAQSFADVLRCGTFEEIRSVIVTLIDHIDIDGDDITIYWNFSK